MAWYRSSNAATEGAGILLRFAKQGDIAEKERPVDFFFECDSLDAAKDLSAYLRSTGYGESSLHLSDDAYKVTATIVMAIDGSRLIMASGLLHCVARLFRAEYTGWGAVVRKGDAVCTARTDT